jgi:hypothetical protein
MYLFFEPTCQLYIWDYSKSGENPRMILRTRRSLRAVHFHPHGAPYLLTAEVKLCIHFIYFS